MHKERSTIKRGVIVFLKAPEKGNVKTRLSRVLDESFVLELYKGFIQDTLYVLQSFPDKFIYFSTFEKEGDLRTWLGDEYQYAVQTGKDLGEKMSNAFREVFSKGYDRLVLIGTDIPEITETVLIRAFDVLETEDAVIGPATDGGYYLIGFKKESFSEKIFQGLNWSTKDVFQETLKVMDKMNLRYERILELNDVDTPEDLKSLTLRIRSGVKIGCHTRKMLDSYEG
ncbi:MAG: TIGR04282 family arsenosugar biosynthesis glycosyltransferase [Desulfobacula sp.]